MTHDETNKNLKKDETQISGELIRTLTSTKKLVELKVPILLKSRDITLPTKVHLVKAVVFPVVMYGHESWTIKKAEC